MADATYDFAIIGAGMAGASLAAELAPHSGVAVLEAEQQPGYHATGRSAAFWDECYGGPDIVPLTVASGSFLRDAGFLRRRGALHIGTQAQKPLVDAFHTRFENTAATVALRDQTALQSAIPGLRPQWQYGVAEPNCSDIDVAALHGYYLKALRQHGGQVMTGFAAAQISRSGGLWQISDLQGRKVKARTLVNAAGAWADPVAQLAGAASIGITPYRRTVVQLRVAPVPDPNLPLVLGIDGSFYFKPDAGSLWVSPHDETPSEPCDTAPEEIATAQAIERLKTVVDWEVVSLQHKWAGLRSFAPDRLPVYGFDPDCPGFFWFAGQGGFGIQTAPAAARLGAQLLLSKPADAMTTALDAARYDPARLRSGLLAANR